MTADPRDVPPSLAALARRPAGGDRAVAVPRHASTVVLLRDVGPGAAGRSGVEAYLLRRVASMAFAAGMYVFPGGSVDPRDADIEVGWVGPAASQWAQVLSADEPLARALVCAAVRETFEECGVLLAGPDEGAVVDVSAPEWEDARQALLDRSVSLAELLARRDLVVRADLLRPWAHWITPELEPKRFDTRFFVAALPAGQIPRDVGGEADHVTWVRPETALEQKASGEMALMPPTAFTLAEIAEYPTVAEVLAAATRRDIKPVLPQIVVSGEQASLLLPGDPGYAG
ncbi:MAG: NUDIX hydrolase [Actinomycetota bacterium]|nr:NUDIX hydrolase [Actinomycetota bacterium]